MKLFTSNKRMLFSTVALVSLSLACILAGCQWLENLVVPYTATQALKTQEQTITPNLTLVPAVETITPIDKNQITLWLPPQFDPGDDTPAGDLLKERIAGFESVNPGVFVDVRIKAVTGKGGLLDSLTTTSSAAPEALPSLIMLSKNDFEIAALKGLIFPVNGAVVPLGDPDWFPFTREFAEIQGVQYGIPFASDPLILAYRTSQIVFPPKTWQEVNQKGTVLSYPGADPLSLISMAMYMSAGGTFRDNEDKLALQSDILKNINQTVLNGVYSGAFPYWLAQLESYEQSWASFLDLHSNMTIIWASDALNNKLSDTTIAPLPTYSSSPFTLIDGWLLCVPDPSIDESDLSIKFANYIMEPVFQQKWTEASGFLPARRSVLTAWHDQVLASTLISIAESAHSIPSNEVLSRVGIIFEESTVNLLKQQENAEQAAQQALQKIQAQD